MIRCGCDDRYSKLLVVVRFVALAVNFLGGRNYRKRARVDFFYNIAQTRVREAFDYAHDYYAVVARVRALAVDERRAYVQLFEHAVANRGAVVGGCHDMHELGGIAAVQHQIERARKREYGQHGVEQQVDILVDERRRADDYDIDNHGYYARAQVAKPLAQQLDDNVRAARRAARAEYQPQPAPVQRAAHRGRNEYVADFGEVRQHAIAPQLDKPRGERGRNQRRYDELAPEKYRAEDKQRHVDNQYERARAYLAFRERAYHYGDTRHAARRERVRVEEQRDAERIYDTAYKYKSVFFKNVDSGFFHDNNQ